MKVSLGDAVKGTEERLHRSTMPEQFVADSLLEGTGFEPSVPLLPFRDGGTKGGATYKV